MRVGSLFSGIGTIDLGLEQAGMTVLWQVENDRFCLKILERHWPRVKRYYDVRHIRAPEKVELIAGGDPCPIRSRARRNLPSSSPDLSGWFLAVVARCCPEWVVRENVPASDVVDFKVALEHLGYGAIVVEINSRYFTGQSRKRQVVLGCPPSVYSGLEGSLSKSKIPDVYAAESSKEKPLISSCLCSNTKRTTPEETYCFEPGRGLRVLHPWEREALQGLPRDWTAGLSTFQRCRLLGNAATVPAFRWLGERIMEVTGGQDGKSKSAR